MTKIFCPIPGCNKSSFGVTESHQIHLNRHLYHDHGVTVSSQNIEEIRQNQDEAWKSRVDTLGSTRSGQAKRFREEFVAFSNNPSLPLPTETIDDAVEEELSTLMDVHDDENLPGRQQPQPVMNARALEAKACSEWFGKGPGYDVSLRTHQSAYNSKVDEEAAKALSIRMRQSVGLPSGSGGDKGDGIERKKDKDSIGKGN